MVHSDLALNADIRNLVNVLIKDPENPSKSPGNISK